MSISFRSAAERYLGERIVSRGYSRRVMAVAAGCRRFNEDSCNRFLKQRLAEVSSVTAAPDRVIVLTIWRYAYERGLVDSMPRGIVKIKVQRPPTRAWTLEQCCTAVKATFQHDRKRLRSGASLGVFLRCWILLGYETGARQEDLWRLRDTDFSGQTVQFTQSKTGNPVPKVLTPSCMEAVRAMLEASPDGRVLGWVMKKEGGYKRMRKHLESLKMRGSGKWLRRSGCTHIEIDHPGKGRLHLGHKTVGLAERFYIDWSQVHRDIPQTPNLLKQ